MALTRLGAPNTVFRYGWETPRRFDIVHEPSVTVKYVSRHCFLAVGTSILGLPHQRLFALRNPHELIPFSVLCNISSESTCPLRPLRHRFPYAEVCLHKGVQVIEPRLAEAMVVAFGPALGPRHRERGLEITNNCRLIGREISSQVIKDFKFDSLNFQGIHIEQDDFSRLFELWYSDQSY